MVSLCCLGLRRIVGDDDVHPFITLHKGMYLGRTPSCARVRKQILRGDTTEYASLGIISNDIPTTLLKTIGLTDKKIILERIMYDGRSIQASRASRVYLNKIRQNQGRSHSLGPGENVDCQEGDTLEIRGQYHTYKFKVDRVDRRSQEHSAEKVAASCSEGNAGRDNDGRFLKKRKDQQQARIGANKRTKSSHDATTCTSSREPPAEEEDGPISPLASTTETDIERELHQDDTNAAVAAAGMVVREQNVQTQDGSPKAGATENTDHTVTPESISNEVDPLQVETEENAGAKLFEEMHDDDELNLIQKLAYRSVSGGRTGDDGGDNNKNNHPPATSTLHGLIERQKIVEAMNWLDDPIGIQDARTQNIHNDLPIHSLIPLATIGSEEHKKACFDLMSKLIDAHPDSLDHPNKKGMIPVQYAEYLFAEKKFIDLLLIKAPHTKRLLAKSTALVAISSRDIDLCYHTNERCNCNARFFEKKARHLTKVDANSMNKELNYAVRTTLKQNMFVEERLTSLVDKSKNKSVTRSFLTDFLDEYHESRSKTDKVLVLCDHEGDCAKCNLNHPIFTSKAEWNSNNNALDVNVIKLNRAIGKCKDLSEHLIAPEKIEENVKEALVTSFFASTQVTSLDHQKEVDSRKQAEETIEDQKKEVSTLNDEKIDLISRNKKMKETNVDQEKIISTLKKRFEAESETCLLAVQREREKDEELHKKTEALRVFEEKYKKGRRKIEECEDEMAKLVDANIMAFTSIDPEKYSAWILEFYADRALESLAEDGVSMGHRRSRLELLHKIVSAIIERQDCDTLKFVAEKMSNHLRECKVENENDWSSSFIDMNGLKLDTISDKFLKNLTTDLLDKISRFHTDTATSAEVKHEILGVTTRSRSNDSQTELNLELIV